MKSKIYRKPNIAVNLLFIILSILVVIPLIYTVSISFSTTSDIMKYGYTLVPHTFDLTAYNYLFQVPKQIITGYTISIIVTIMGTVLGLMLSSSIAYLMTRRDYRYRKITSFYVFFTMLFNGGLVPFYMVMTRILHLQDTIFALVIPYSINAWFTILMKGFMQTLPFEIIESAKIDGSSEFRTFLKIILPLSKPALATVGLFYAFAYWNDWWLAMLFINKESLVPLQFMLYRTMNNLSYLLSTVSMVVDVDMSKIPSESVRMAMAVLAAGPMLVIFPFFQRYFVKGLTVGSVKG
jgi:putative aldouronate transport system permease protein